MRALCGMLLICGLLLSSGCFGKGDPVRRDSGTGNQRMAKDKGPISEKDSSKEAKKGVSMRPDD